MIAATSLASTVLAGALWCAPAIAAAGAPVAGVPFETLGVVSAPSGVNLLEGSLLAVRNEHDIEGTRELLALGHDDSFADEIVGVIDAIPADRVVLIGVIDSSCTPAKDAGLRLDEEGELEMFAPGHHPEPVECVVAVVTVGIVAVAADDAPVGAGDGATLVGFSYVGSAAPSEPNSVEITGDDSLLSTILPDDAELPDLPPRDPGDRRFGFVRSGCANTTAELMVTPQLIDVRLGYDEHGLVVNCAMAEYFVAVFDVPADLVREIAQLQGA